MFHSYVKLPEDNLPDISPFQEKHPGSMQRRAFHPLGHSKPPQVFSQHSALAVASTWDASGLGNEKDLTNEGPWGCGRIDGILMNITVMNINEYCIYTYLHILSLYKCLAIDIDGTTGLSVIIYIF